MKHGMYKTDTYKTYRGMISRCTNPKRPNYHLYGGRGIQVCARWLHSFENFIEDMGEKPTGYQIDRIDSDGNYEPGNCRWVTPKDNSNNRRKKPDIVLGNKFNNWKAIELLLNRDPCGSLLYLCECICGNTSIVKKKSLIRGESKQCKNCADKIYKENVSQYVGKKIGEWIICAMLDKRNSTGNILFLCQCKCGRHSEKIISTLLMEKSKACRSCSAFMRTIKKP